MLRKWQLYGSLIIIQQILDVGVDTLTSDDRQTSKSDQVLARFRAIQESIINTAYRSTVDDKNSF